MKSTVSTLEIHRSGTSILTHRLNHGFLHHARQTEIFIILGMEKVFVEYKEIATSRYGKKDGTIMSDSDVNARFCKDEANSLEEAFRILIRRAELQSPETDDYATIVYFEGIKDIEPDPFVKTECELERWIEEISMYHDSGDDFIWGHECEWHYHIFGRTTNTVGPYKRVILNCTYEDGRQEIINYTIDEMDADSVEITLPNKGLVDVDLSHCAHLDVEYIDLSNNNLEQLDLTVIDTIYMLSELDLHHNRLTRFDMSCLHRATYLEKLDLSQNHLQQLDLNPLRGLKNLKSILLKSNPLKKLNITPLLHLTQLEEFQVDPDTTLHALNSKHLRERIPPALQDKSIEWVSWEELLELYPDEHDVHLIQVLANGEKEKRYLREKEKSKTVSPEMIALHVELQSNTLGIPLEMLINRLYRDHESNKITIIDLSALELTNIDLQPLLSDFPQLKFIDLRGNDLKELDLTPFQFHSHLNPLDVILVDVPITLKTSLTVTDLKGKKKQWKFIIENLRNARISPSERRHRADSLHDISDFSPLHAFPDLHSLDLSSLYLRRVDLTTLKPLQKLRQLLLHSNYIDHLDVSPLVDHDSLEEIHVDFLTTIKNADTLPSHVRIIRHPTFPAKSETNGDYIMKKEIPLAAKEIVLSGCHFMTLECVRLYHDLEHLTIKWSSNRELDLTPLASCSRLKTIELWQNENLTNLDLTPLQELKELEVLSLADNALESIDLTPLQHCQNLRKLHLHENPLKELDLTPLMNLPRLEEVTVKDISIIQHPDLHDENQRKQLRFRVWDVFMGDLEFDDYYKKHGHLYQKT